MTVMSTPGCPRRVRPVRSAPRERSNGGLPRTLECFESNPCPQQEQRESGKLTGRVGRAAPPEPAKLGDFGVAEFSIAIQIHRRWSRLGRLMVASTAARDRLINMVIGHPAGLRSGRTAIRHSPTAAARRAGRRRQPVWSRRTDCQCRRLGSCRWPTMRGPRGTTWKASLRPLACSGSAGVLHVPATGSTKHDR